VHNNNNGLLSLFYSTELRAKNVYVNGLFTLLFYRYVKISSITYVILWVYNQVCKITKRLYFLYKLQYIVE
jgi:hypothetical protein